MTLFKEEITTFSANKNGKDLYATQNILKFAGISLKCVFNCSIIDTQNQTQERYKDTSYGLSAATAEENKKKLIDRFKRTGSFYR